MLHDCHNYVLRLSKQLILHRLSLVSRRTCSLLQRVCMVWVHTCQRLATPSQMQPCPLHSKAFYHSQRLWQHSRVPSTSLQASGLALGQDLPAAYLSAATVHTPQPDSTDWAGVIIDNKHHIEATTTFDVVSSHPTLLVDQYACQPNCPSVCSLDLKRAAALAWVLSEYAANTTTHAVLKTLRVCPQDYSGGLRVVLSNSSGWLLVLAACWHQQARPKTAPLRPLC